MLVDISDVIVRKALMDPDVNKPDTVSMGTDGLGLTH